MFCSNVYCLAMVVENKGLRRTSALKRENKLGICIIKKIGHAVGSNFQIFYIVIKILDGPN